MAKKQSILKATKVLSASAASKRRIKSISKKIGSKDLFPAKVNLAKETLSGLKSLPI